MGLCFELLAGHEFLEPLLKQGCYLLTPGWLARWREYIKRWGFDQNTAREFFAESTPRLVLLDTLVDPNSAKELEGICCFCATAIRDRAGRFGFLASFPQESCPRMAN